MEHTLLVNAQLHPQVRAVRNRSIDKWSSRIRRNPSLESFAGFRHQTYAFGFRGRKVMSLRPVKHIIQTTPTIEGAGVKLQRAFGLGKTKELDPFLLLDDFRNDNPQAY